MAQRNIFIIRHCDKDTGNGCTAQGYARAKKWGSFFAKKNLKTPLIYAFGFKLKGCVDSQPAVKIRQNACLVDIEQLLTDVGSDCAYNHTGCSSSQRAFITACGASGISGAQVITEFCVGHEEELVNDLYNQNGDCDIIISWEHNGIIDILNAMSKKFKSNTIFDPWNDKDKNVYNLLFTIPRLSGGTMPAITVQCVMMGLDGDELSCSTTRKWITKIDKNASPDTWKIMETSLGKANALQPEDDNQSSSSTFIIIIIVLFLVICIIGVAIFYSNSDVLRF
jgi:hypothetical protein